MGKLPSRWKKKRAGRNKAKSQQGNAKKKGNKNPAVVHKVIPDGELWQFPREVGKK